LFLNDLKNFAKCAVAVEEQNGFLQFCRFPVEQAQQYITALNNPDFYRKTKATAGVRLELKTDAKQISFDYKPEPASSRSFCYFDLYVNGHLTAAAAPSRLPSSTRTLR
jgi:hypothetical protein